MMEAPTNLRCQYFTNPLAIDVPRPRLSWIVNDDRRDAKQTAYHVVVRSGGSIRWDSGKVQSDQSVHVEYAGEALRARTRCTWKVRTWDADDQPSPWSEPAHFEMAFLDRSDWKAKWI